MSGVVVPLDTQIPLYRKEYTSPEQTITSAGSLTLAHGLGVKPSDVRAWLVCKIAEVGYSIGDEINADHQQTDTSILTLGFAYNKDSVNVGIVFGTNSKVFVTKDKSTNAIAQLTNANWRLVVRAWAEPAPVQPNTDPLKAATLKSKAAATPTVFEDNAAREIGQLCTAWANFNGTGVVAINDSFNVSSITDNGVGNYTVNFANNMANIHYTLAGSVVGSSSGTFFSVITSNGNSNAVSASGFTVKNTVTDANVDLSVVGITVHGGL